jgi:FtsZ-interacting cell division protein ZipA
VITVGVLVPVVVVFIVIAIILTIIVVIKFWRKRRAHDDVNEKAPESHIIAQEVNTDDGRGEKVVPNPTAALNPLEVTLTAQEEQPPPYYASVKHEPPVNPLELNMINNGEEPKPTEPSLYDNRSSLVESDFHLPTDTNLNSKPQLVTICEDDEAQQTGRTRYH